MAYFSGQIGLQGLWNVRGQLLNLENSCATTIAPARKRCFGEQAIVQVGDEKEATS